MKISFYDHSPSKGSIQKIVFQTDLKDYDMVVPPIGSFMSIKGGIIGEVNEVYYNFESDGGSVSIGYRKIDSFKDGKPLYSDELEPSHPPKEATDG